MRKILNVTAIVLAALTLAAFAVSAETLVTKYTYNPGYINVCEMGAIPNDGKDDTDAFNAAFLGNSPVYIPAGVYNITQTIAIENGTIMGAGVDKTVIVADIKAVKDPVIMAGRSCVIKNLTVKYADGCVTGSENMGDRVGIICGNKYSLQRGSTLENIKFENVGTGIYSHIAGLPNGQGCVFSATFEKISVVDFSFRGFDFEHEARTGNVYRDIYISSGKYEADAGFYMGGHESEMDLCELTIENSVLNTPVKFEDVYCLSATNINIISTKLSANNQGYVYFDATAGNVDSINLIDCVPLNDRHSFIRLGDNIYRSYAYNCAGYVEIDNLNILNGDSASLPSADHNFVSRRVGYLNEYTVRINNYNFTAPSSDEAAYKAFNSEDKEINVIVERINGVEQ